ncbi:hypothetical protein PMAYCL1PPCAC_18079, partial [Pristionchus mayeri]
VRMDVSQLSDAQLRDELKKYDITVGPVVGTTRIVYEKKLLTARKKGPPPPSAASKTPAPTPSRKTASPSRASSRGRKAPTTRSESEERSDTETQPVVAPSRAKPVASTPKKKEKVTSPAPVKSTPTYPIPGLNTSMSFKSSVDKPGHTPPRSKVTPKTPSTRPNLNVSSFSTSRSRGMMETEPATSGDESDDHEESSRFISPSSTSFLSSFGSTRRTAVKSPVLSAVDSVKRKAESSFSFLRKKPTLDFDDDPLSSYDMQVGGRHTRVANDPKTGQIKVSQSVETAYDVSRILLIVLSIFLALLLIAYLCTAKKEAVVGSLKTVAGAAQDTVLFVYNYAIFPLLLVAFLAVVVASVYWMYSRRNKAMVEEEEALYQLIEQITNTVRESYESGEEYISIPHVRDQIFPPAKRRGTELTRWERAVQFVNEKESRIVTEAVYLRGIEVPSWKWIGAGKKQGWRGSAYSSAPVVKPVSSCLKVRNMYNVETGFEDEAEEVVAEVYAKLKPIVPLRVHTANENRDPCVYIKLSSKEEAATVFSLLHSQWFNGQLLHVKFIPDKRFDERFPPSDH